MEESRIRRGLLLEKVYTAISNPAPDLARDQSREHDKEPGPNLLSKDCHGQTCLGDGKPCSLGKLFDLDRAQRAKAYLRQGIDEASVQEQCEIDQNLDKQSQLSSPTVENRQRGRGNVTYQQTEVALRKIHHSRVEVGPLVKCRENDCTRQGSRHLE